MSSAFTADSIRLQREHQDDRIREEQYLDGATDAAFGRLAQFADEAYLAGYVAKLKELPRDATGYILHHSPDQHFAFGYLDGVGNAIDGESNHDEF